MPNGDFKVSIGGKVVGRIRRFEPKERRELDSLLAQEKVAVDLYPSPQMSFDIQAERMAMSPAAMDMMLEPESLRALFERLGVEPPKELEAILDSAYWFESKSTLPEVGMDENGNVVFTTQTQTYTVTNPDAEDI